MKTPQEVLGEVILAVIGLVLVGAVVYWFGGKVIDLIQAPAREESLRGNNAALAKGSEAQNKGLDGLQKAGEARQAKSAAAVEAAGKVPTKRAAEIQSAPAVGATDYEKAVNRIDRELGLK